MLIAAIVAISLALVFYTVTVFWERRTGMLRGRHLLLFWLGLICDTTGTTLMARIAGADFGLNFHAVTGALAIVLMLGHALWATIVHADRRVEPKRSFHRYSIAVWALWLVPYLSGMIFGARAGL